MKNILMALAMAGTLLVAGCATNSVVHQNYKASAAETYCYEIQGNEDTDEENLAMLRTQLDAHLAEAQLSGGQAVAGSRKVEIKITHYYVRHNAARILVGIMAGRDKVMSEVTVRGEAGDVVARFDVESTNATAWGTTNGLIGKHADEIVTRLKTFQ